MLACDVPPGLRSPIVCEQGMDPQSWQHMYLAGGKRCRQQLLQHTSDMGQMRSPVDLCSMSSFWIAWPKLQAEILKSLRRYPSVGL